MLAETLLTEYREAADAPEYDAFKHLCRAAFPDTGGHRLVGYVIAHSDASYNQHSADPLVHTVGTYICTDTDWVEFRGEWNAWLIQHGVDDFHATDFNRAWKQIKNDRRDRLGSKDYYRDWDESDFEPFLDGLHEIINAKRSDGRYRMEAFIGSHVKADFVATLPDELKAEPGCTSHYIWNVANNMECIAQWADANGYTDPIHYVFATGDRPEGNNLELWFHQCWTNELFKNRFRLSKRYTQERFTRASAADEPAIQAADLASWEFNQASFTTAREGRLDIQLLRKELLSLCRGAKHNGKLWTANEFKPSFAGMLDFRRRHGGKAIVLREENEGAQ